jgi:hypothetical protein
MLEFVNKQLPGWILEGVASGLSNLPPAPSTLTIEQIREVVWAEQPKINPFMEQVQKEKREREYQKEKEAFTNWMKEQWKEAEIDMEKRLAARTEHVRKLVHKPVTLGEEEEGEASVAAVDRLARWASLVPSSENPAMLPSPREPSLPPPPPPQTKKSQSSTIILIILVVLVRRRKTSKRLDQESKRKKRGEICF